MQRMGTMGKIILCLAVLISGFGYIQGWEKPAHANGGLSVGYDGNGHTGGTSPVDSSGYSAGDTVTVFGNSGKLAKEGYEFAGWNTLADGTGTNYALGATFVMGESSVTLFAKWAAETPGIWRELDAGGISPNRTAFSSVAVDEGIPYIAYMDFERGGKATVKKYADGAWKTIGSPGFSPGNANYMKMAIDGGTPYVGFSDPENAGKETVMRYNGTDWEMVGTPGFSVGMATYNSIFVENGIPYVAYTQVGSGKLAVKKFSNGAWESIGPADGMTPGQALLASLFVENGTPYVAYMDWSSDRKIAVQKFNGESGIWENVGASAPSGGIGEYPSLYVEGGTPYIAFTEPDNRYRMVVKKLIGNVWERIGAADFYGGGLGQSTLHIEQGAPILVYQGASGKATVRRYIDGEWELVGTAGFSKGAAMYLAGAADGSRIYAGYADRGSSDIPVVIRYIIPPLTYTIGALDDLTMRELPAAYASGTQETKTVTILRTGTGELASLAVSLDGANADAFTITQPAAGRLDQATPSTAFTVTARDGLAPGVYEATVIVKADRMADVSFIAKQVVQAPPSYAVTYDGNGSTGGTVPVDSQVYEHGASVTVAGNSGGLGKTGHAFMGWNTASDGSGTDYEAGSSFAMPAGGVTLYAKWAVEQHTVTFDSNGGTAVGSQTLNYGGMAAKPEDPAMAGHTFSGWYTNRELTTPFVFTTAITGDTTLYAKWTVNQQTVSFETNGGTLVSSQSVDYGSVATKPEDPTKAGHTFSGWYTNRELTTPFAFTTAITGDTTLYAKWTVNQQTVSFESNGGTVVGSETVNYGSVATKPEDPTKTGYTFSGWYTNRELTTPFAFTTAITGDTTLYAKWTVNQQTVSFETNGGTPVSSQSVDYGSVATKPEAPTKAGHTFSGWYANRELTTPFAFTTAITGDTTLYAKWTQVNTSTDSGWNTAEPPVATVVNSTNGQLRLLVGQAGEVSLGSEVTLTVPGGASSTALAITIEKLTDTASLIGDDESLASPIFEMLKNDPNPFRVPVTLSFLFDPARIPSGRQAAVFYYDEIKKTWVEVEGAQVDGNRITVRVDHFTKFAVFADGPAETGAADGVFRDIAGHWAAATIRQALRDGIVSGYEDGTFKPNAMVTRAEFAVMLVQALNPQAGEARLAFADVGQIGEWAKSAVARAVQAGILSGLPDGTLRPNAAISRAEMAVMVARALDRTPVDAAAAGFTDEQRIPTWAKSAAATLKQLGLMQGGPTGAFAPLSESTRAEAVTVLLKAAAYKNG
ncbi:InlB B-repeat-containing protein [Paenibacillus aurantiacus]|uniref:InlB B-repeat-containing protein n=1 Tax=Paenibacillus aurantiacus TaxID=1936118 RepID=A0ABV5KLU2_9BACL